MENLMKAGRVIVIGDTPRYVRYFDDFPIYPISNRWADTVISGFGEDKKYVVQTLSKVIARCVLMTTDPGDLVFDPTCVRKETRVWVKRLVDGDNAETKHPCSPPVNGGTDVTHVPGRSVPPNLDAQNPTPSPFTGRVGEGASIVSTGRVGEGSSSVSTGRVGEGAARGRHDEEVASPCDRPVNGGTDRKMKTEETTENALKIEGVLIPIEDITPGDLVRSHDGRYHSVVRTIRKRYRGTMVGLKHANSPHTLWVTADHRVLCQQRKRSFGANRSWKHVPVPHFERARSLRREPTPAEKRLWKRLKGNQLGVKFRKQHPIGPYIVDFYSRDCHLVIEADGDSHFIGDGPEYDIQRDAYLRSHGVKVLRFTNREIAQQTEAVMEQIAEAVTETEPADTPLRQWRRADSLEVGDIAYFGYDATPVVVTDLSYQETDEEVFDLEVENAHSYLTEVCMVHNCGSGTGQLAGARGRQASAAQRHTQHLGSRRRRFETF